MNKKFSTLLAGAFLATAFSVNAQVAPGDVKAGEYYYIGTSDSYLTIGDNYNQTAKDSIMFVEKANADLWNVAKAGYDEATGVQRYTITSKKGVVLSVAKSDKAPYSIRGGISEFQLKGDKNGFSIAAAVKAGQVIYLNPGVAANSPIPTAQGASLTIQDPGTATLTADQISDFSVFTLVANPAVTKNPFEGVVVRAKDVNGWIKFEVADKPGFAIGVDTTFTTIHNQANVFGAILKADSTYKVNEKHTVSNEDFQLFKVVKTLKNDQMTLTVKAAPEKVRANTSTPFDTRNDVVVKYAKIDNLKVMTVSDDTQGEKLTFTQTPGTPASLPNGSGVYFLRNKNTHDANGTAKNENYNKYYGEITTEFVDKVSNLSIEGQYYVEAKDGRYAVVSRMQGDDEVAAYAIAYPHKEIYKVGENLYSFNGKDTIEFVYAKEVTEAKDRFLGFKSFTKEECKNEAFALNLVSGTEGVDGLYAFAKDSLISIKSTDFENAIKFKVNPVELKTYAVENEYPVWNKVLSTKNFMDFAGAQILKDTLSAAAYTLTEQYTKNAVSLDVDYSYDAVKFLDRYAVNFVFLNGDKADEFKMLPVSVGVDVEDIEATDKEVSDELIPRGNKVVFNVKTAALVYVDENDVRDDFVKFEKAPAPEYATLGAPAHMILSSSEGDSKALSMNPSTLFAEVKTADQAPYIDSLFGLWIDTACVKDVTKPLYYVTTCNGLDSATQKAGYKYFLVNPYDSAYVADEDGWAIVNDKSAYLFKDHYYNTYVKAAFVKGIVYGADSLVIVRENTTAADTLKNMAVNPAAMAFRTTAATEGTTNLVVESNVNTFYDKDADGNQLYEPQSYFLKVINNVLVWSTVLTDAHQFNVATTTLHPTSNDEVAVEGVKVLGANGSVVVLGAAGKNVTVATVLGKTVASQVIASDNATIAAPAGVVFVTVDGETTKVVVK